MLHYARGSINIGSSDPESDGIGGEKGQLAFLNNKSGSFFTGSFCLVFGETSFSDHRFSKNDFSNLITSVQNKINVLVEERKKHNSSDIIEQGSQDIKEFANTLR
jgi:hypothetical protein